MIRLTTCVLLAGLGLCGSAGAQEATRRFGPPDATATLTLRTTTDIDAMDTTIESFLATMPGLALVYEQWGSNDLHALTEAECLAGTPQADIVISSGVHQLVKLVNDRCAAPWFSPETAALPAARRWRNEIWGITREPAVMVFNRRLVPPDEVPQTRFDLLDLLRPEGSAYAGRVATYDIEQSGLGFLFAFMDAQEASTFGALMEAFARTNAVATCCSAEIIAGVSRGDYLIAYNVLGSYAASAAARDPSLGIVLPDDYTLILSRAAILPGREPAVHAGALLDFLLSARGQIAMAAQGLTVAEADATIDDETASERPIALSPALLVAMDRAHVQRFVARWRAVFGS